MSYLRCLCFFAYSGIQHIFYCVFVLFVFMLCILCHFLWIVQLLLPLRYSLAFIYCALTKPVFCKEYLPVL
jgi:hypothetical protein